MAGYFLRVSKIMTNETQPVNVPMTDLGRKLWKAARRVTQLEYEVARLRAQRYGLMELVKDLLPEEGRPQMFSERGE